jgi:DNA polymerase theta
MRGRAGRKGKDEIGETYMCCQKSDLEAVAELIEAEIPSVQSSLLPEKRGIKRCVVQSEQNKIEKNADFSSGLCLRLLLQN